jgi:hypothetical protein
MTIPSSVTSIGDLAFDGCTRLTSASFLGDAPTMGSEVFSDTASGFTVHYVNGAAGFTSPTWEGYPSINSIPTTVAGSAGQSGSSDTASAATSPAKDTSPPSPSTSGPVAGQPWTNSLGVKFVPAGTDGILFSVWDVRVKDYAAFVTANPEYDAGTDWKNPGFTQTENDPAVNVTWNDAHAFCAWLTKKEQAEGKLGPSQSYRLPTDTEWSKAVGLGDEGTGTPNDKDSKIKDVYPWGTQWPPPQGAGNYDESLTHDGYANTSPVASFAANKYGLYDMGGNVWQWCEDWSDNDQRYRVLRGASWFNSTPDYMLSSDRFLDVPGYRSNVFGFRVVVVVSP